MLRNRFEKSPRAQAQVLWDVNINMDINEFIKTINHHLGRYHSLTPDNGTQICTYLRNFLQGYYIKFHFENTACLENSEFRRIRFVLSTIRQKANFNIPLVRHSNGLVFHIIESDSRLKCEVLAKPSRDFNPKFKREQIKLDNYNVYELKDGTVINLYWDPFYKKTEGSWVFGTKNSFDVGNNNWRGFKYNDIIADVLKEYPKFQFDILDKTKTYVLNFTHPAFHPFGQPAIYNTKTANDPQIKWVKKIWTVTDDDVLCNMDLFPQEPVNLDNNYKIKLTTAFHDYLENKGTPFLGYIFRTKDEFVTGSYSDLLMESSLWLEIKNLIYQLPYDPNATIREKREQNFKNMDYIIINAYLSYKRRNIFIELFPQYQAVYNKLNTLVEILVDKIYQKLSNPSISIEHESELCKRMYDVVAEEYQITPEVEKSKNPVVTRPGMSKIDKKNIRSLIVRPKFTEFYQLSLCS